MTFPSPLPPLRYCHSLVTEASAVLVKRWNTETLCSPDVHVFMSLVRLPDESWQKKGTKEGEEAIATSVDAKTVQGIIPALLKVISSYHHHR